MNTNPDTIRTFSDNEKKMMAALMSNAADPSITVNDFLSNYYFTEEQSRALIIQNEGEYAVFFLKTELFNSEVKRNAEVKDFFEMITLLNYLNKGGYITIYRSKPVKLYYIQDGFNSAHVVHNKIVLNNRGEYSLSPDTIHDANNLVVYKGLVFHADQYRLILDATTGALIVSDRLKNLMNNDTASTANNTASKVAPASLINDYQPTHMQEPVTERPYPGDMPESPRSSSFKWPLILIALLSVFLLAAAGFTYSKVKQHELEISAMDTQYKKLKDSLSDIYSTLINIRHDSKVVDHPLKDSAGKYYGIDISKWNGNEAAEIPSKDSITFVVCKATEGLSFIDDDFRKNWKIIRDNNYLLGTYHFYRTKDDPVAQANFYWKTISANGPTDLAPIIDIEEAGMEEGASADGIEKDVLSFLMQLEKICGRKPIIYTDLNFANRYLHDKSFSRYKLWLAEYTSKSKPAVPAAWRDGGYMIWQKMDNYFIDTKASDFDIFYGRKSELLN